MKILAIDTATGSCSVAIRDNGSTVAQAFEQMERGQSEALIPMVLDVVAKANVTLDGFDLIAATCGPGAFTGLRIGLSTARGLALASGVRCCGITTTQTLAEAARQTESAARSYIAAVDSKRSDVYLQAFDSQGRELSMPEAIAIDSVRCHIDDLQIPGPVSVVGDAADRVLTLLPDGFLRSTAGDLPDAQYVAALADRLLASGQELPDPSPLYLRPPDAALPKNGGRLRP